MAITKGINFVPFWSHLVTELLKATRVIGLLHVSMCACGREELLDVCAYTQTSLSTCWSSIVKCVT